MFKKANRSCKNGRKFSKCIPGILKKKYVQSNFNTCSLNTDGSFTMAHSSSFFNPYEIVPRAQENRYLGKISYFIMKLYVVFTH